MFIFHTIFLKRYPYLVKCFQEQVLNILYVSFHLLVTCCVDFRVHDEDVRLMLWDTAGQEEFDAITKAYYRGKWHD